MRRLPHLTAIRAFEAAARHESFARAGDELCVSHSAVSQQIRVLEDWLGIALFTRHGNRVTITEEGRMIAHHLSEGFDKIEAAIAPYGRRKTGKTELRVLCEPAFAARWLVSRLSRFRRAHSQVDIVLSTQPHLSRSDHAAADLLVHFEGNLAAPGRTLRRLFPVIAFPACAPDMAEGFDGVDDIFSQPGITLIHDYDTSVWQQWFARHRPGSAAWQDGVVYSDLSLAIDAAIAGEGIVLADRTLCGQEIESGRLVALSDETLEAEHYSLTMGGRGTSDAALGDFVDWLVAEARATAA